MSNFLDDLLVDPDSREPLKRASDAQLADLRRAIEGGKAKRRDGGELPTELDGAYLCQGGRVAYPILGGIPTLLVEERIELNEPLAAESTGAV